MPAKQEKPVSNGNGNGNGAMSQKAFFGWSSFILSIIGTVGFFVYTPMKDDMSKQENALGSITTRINEVRDMIHAEETKRNEHIASAIDKFQSGPGNNTSIRQITALQQQVKRVETQMAGVGREINHGRKTNWSALNGTRVEVGLEKLDYPFSEVRLGDDSSSASENGH